MEFFKTVVITIIILSCSSVFSLQNKNHILYLMHNKQHEKAIQYYQELYKETNEQDFNILQQLAILILEGGAKSSDPIERQLSMFGAGLATSSLSLKILEKGLQSPEMETQLTALHFISALQDNEANNLLVKAMSSEFLEMRIEAAMQMAIKKHPCAFGQIQSLMQRLPPFLKPFFPQFFGIIGTSDATRILKNLLFDKDPNVRVQAILSIAQNNRDDLVYILKRKIKHASLAEKEALAAAISLLNDSSCNDDLKKMQLSASDNIKLAISLALYHLGDKTYTTDIHKLASRGNLFAVQALGKIEGAENILFRLSKSQNTQMRINASIALLNKKDARCLEGLKELLINRENDLAISLNTSLGRTLNHFQVVIPSKKRKNIDLNQSLDIKQSILKQTLELDETTFLNLASEIFNNNETTLVPYLCQLISNLNTDNAINFLKKYAVKTGAPLIRDYCNLSLYRMNIDGDYFNYIKKWLKKNNNQELIHLKPFDKNKVKYEKNQYTLSPDESTFLLVEMFSALAEKHNIEGIMLLLDCLKTTHKLNRYPLAGILLRATE